MSNIQLAITDPEYKQWISNIERRFRLQQIKAAVQVNSSKIEFYWSLGRDICEMHVEERWGESVIKQLSEDLRLAIDEAKGLTPGNLYYCKRFYSLYNQLFEKVPQDGEIFKPLHAITENRMLPLNIFAIPWGHHKIILDRYESEPKKALFYAAKTLEHSWSRAVLENMMGDKVGFLNNEDGSFIDFNEEDPEDPYMMAIPNVEYMKEEWPDWMINQKQ